jgi:hypothetical protein
VTDAGLPQLAALKLEALKLNKLPITDEGLKALDAMTSLRSIEVNDTHVSSAGYEMLSKQHRGIDFPNRRNH